jgi:hypothetical protein
MKIDFKQDKELLYLFKKFTGCYSPKSPVLGAGIQQKEEIIDKDLNKVKTIVFGLVKIYDYINFKEVFLKKFEKDLDCKVPANSPYDAVLPCVLYTDPFTSFNFKGIVDIYPTALVLYSTSQNVVLVGGVKKSPCPNIFYKDIPIYKARNVIKVKDVNQEVIQENDFESYVLDTMENRALRWNSFLDFNFHILGEDNFIDDVLKTPDVYIVKINNKE